MGSASITTEIEKDIQNSIFDVEIIGRQGICRNYVHSELTFSEFCTEFSIICLRDSYDSLIDT